MRDEAYARSVEPWRPLSATSSRSTTIRKHRIGKLLLTVAHPTRDEPSARVRARMAARLRDASMRAIRNPELRPSCYQSPSTLQQRLIRNFAKRILCFAARAWTRMWSVGLRLLLFPRVGKTVSAWFEQALSLKMHFALRPSDFLFMPYFVAMRIYWKFSIN